MSGFEDLKDFFRRRLKVIRDEEGEPPRSGYEEELHRQRKVLQVILTPEIKLWRADVQQLWSSRLDQKDTEPPHIKEEQEEHWISQSGEKFQGLEEAETTNYPFESVSVKTEDDEEKPRPSQPHQIHTETGADGENCRGAEPARCSDPVRNLQPEIEVKTEDSSEQEGEDSSEPETEDSEDWKETRKHNSGLISGNNFKDRRPDEDKKSLSCSECGKTFKWKRNMTQHMIIHTGEKPFRCSQCGRRFNQKSNMTRHMAQHRLQVHYSCRVFEQRHHQLIQQKCAGIQASELHENQTEEKRKAETGADGEDCGGAAPARSSDPERQLRPETGDKTDTRQHPTGLNSVKVVFDKRLKEDNEVQSCSECNKRFTLKGDLIRHQVVHTGERPFCCPECGKGFNQNRHLSSHMRLHTGVKPFCCSYCGNTFSSQSNPTLHMTHRRGENRYSCSDCKQTELHKKQSEDKREAEIGANGEEFGGTTGNSDPEKHLQTEIEVKTEDCSETEIEDNDDYWKQTKEKQSRINSKITHKNNEYKTQKKIKKSHHCTECGKSFKDKWNMIQHIRIHTGEKPFSCSDCGKGFNSKGNLTIHMKIHTQDKPFSCSICHRKFNHTGRLSSHMRIHTGEKPFSCSECGNKFNQKGTLSTHVRIHTGEKPFSCSVCGKRFYRRGNLISHMLVHTDEKPFCCSRCGKRFNHKSNLKQHMTNHREEKCYSCSVCDQRFSCDYQLKQHKCDGSQASLLPKKQSVEEREAEPGAEERHFQLETENGDSDDGWMESRDYQSGSNSRKNFKDKRPETDPRLHSCSECGKTFRWKRNMIQHMIVHTGEKPFGCSECGKRFNQKSNLTRHLATSRHKKRTRKHQFLQISAQDEPGTPQDVQRLWSPSLDQVDTGLEGELLQGLDEDETAELPFSVVTLG